MVVDCLTLFVGCWLMDVCYSLFVVACWLFIDGCLWLLVVGNLLLVVC